MNADDQPAITTAELAQAIVAGIEEVLAIPDDKRRLVMVTVEEVLDHTL